MPPFCRLYAQKADLPDTPGRVPYGCEGADGADGRRRSAAPLEFGRSRKRSMGSGVAHHQMRIRQHVRDDVAAERGVAVTAVAADAGELGGVLIEDDVVGLMRVGG
jgi:hypothetical protein